MLAGGIDEATASLSKVLEPTCKTEMHTALFYAPVSRAATTTTTRKRLISADPVKGVCVDEDAPLSSSPYGWERAAL